MKNRIITLPLVAMVALSLASCTKSHYECDEFEINIEKVTREEAAQAHYDPVCNGDTLVFLNKANKVAAWIQEEAFKQSGSDPCNGNMVTCAPESRTSVRKISVVFKDKAKPDYYKVRDALLDMANLRPMGYSKMEYYRLEVVDTTKIINDGEWTGACEISRKCGIVVREPKRFKPQQWAVDMEKLEFGMTVDEINDCLAPAGLTLSKTQDTTSSVVSIIIPGYDDFLEKKVERVW